MKVLDIKSKIEKAEGHLVNQQKLIFAAKVLADDSTLASLSVKENDFFVLMVTKPKATVEVKTESIKEEASKQNEEQTKGSVEVNSENVAHTEESNETSNALLVGEEYESAIQNMIDMGFARDEVIRAMNASFNNPVRAVEYLSSGEIPDEFTEQESDRLDRGNVFDGLRNDPQFLQFRQVIQQNPQMLAPMIQQIGQANPRLLQLITENEDDFFALLNDTETDPQPSEYIQLTEEENEAIDRLVALGFEKARAVEAYFACDKNETLAANYLFDHMDDQDF